MAMQAMTYQSDLLRDLVQAAQADSTLSPAEAEHLRERISEATSEQEIAELWTDLHQDFELLDEEKWAT